MIADASMYVAECRCKDNLAAVKGVVANEPSALLYNLVAREPGENCKKLFRCASCAAHACAQSLRRSHATTCLPRKPSALPAHGLATCLLADALQTPPSVKASALRLADGVCAYDRPPHSKSHPCQRVPHKQP